jgi:hypothetical protein
MNNKQKVAWAHAHGVTPPDFVIAAAEREGEGPQQVCTDEASCETAACSHHEERACCRARHAHHEAVLPDASREREKNEKVEPRARLVLSDFARQCSGLPQLIMLFADALPCVVSAQWKPAESTAGFVVEVARPWVSADLSPPVPPPKLARGLAA